MLKQNAIQHIVTDIIINYLKLSTRRAKEILLASSGCYRSLPKLRWRLIILKILYFASQRWLSSKITIYFSLQYTCNSCTGVGGGALFMRECAGQFSRG